MLALSVDSTRMAQKVAGMRQRLPSARELGLRSLADKAADAFERISPRDTNRYVRAWLEAAGGAGSNPRPIPVLQASKNAAYIRKRIVGQYVEQHRAVLRTEKWINSWWPPGSKINAFARSQLNRLAKMKKREERLLEEIRTLDASPTDAVLLIGGRGKNGFATVRTRIYGGTGFVDVGAGVMYMRNMEAHAYIVESKRAIKKIVGRYVQLLGGRIISNRYAITMIAGQRGLGMRSGT